MLEGKIIVIFSPTEFIIDIGNLKVGTRLAIKDSKNEITIPVEGEPKFSRTKGYIEVKESFENFSYCQTPTKKITMNFPNSLNWYSSIYDILTKELTKERVFEKNVELKVDEEAIKQLDFDPVVRLGDRVIVINE